MSRPQGVSADNNTSFSVKFSARVFFYQCQVNSRLVTILTSQVFFEFFMNLVDRDLTEHQITQTLTLSRLDAQLEQTREIRLFTHTQQVDWSRQGESDCLIKQVILRLLSSVQCSAICANLWSDFMEWIHDEYSVVEKHAQTMLQLVELGMDWDMWRTGADREHSSYSVCGREELNVPVAQIVEEISEVNIPVPQNVEEIAEVSKSEIEWRNIPNFYFEEIKVFLG